MRKLIYVVPLLLLCSPCFATWTCAQGATGCTDTTSRTCNATAASCNITVASTPAGAVEIMCAASDGSTTATMSGSGDGTWTTATGSLGNDATAGRTECAYNLNATGGATTITCNHSTSTALACIWFAFTGTGSSFTFDTSGAIDNSVACTSCTGVALTLGTSNNYILVQSAVCAGNCSAINQSYTGIFLTGDGTAFKINVSAAGTTPAWTSTSGRNAGGAIAIYEVAGGTKNCTLALMGVGPC